MQNPFTSTMFAIASATVLTASALLTASCTSGESQEAREAQQLESEGSRPRINARPNLNGIWQALNTANWNLEGQSAQAIDEWWQLGALGGMPAGEGVVLEGTIPYRLEALEQREINRASYPEGDPETACYMPGIPRANYQPFPFQIVQGDGNIQFIYSFAKANRVVYITDPTPAEEVPVDLWMGWSNGRWEGDTLVVEVVANDSRTWLDRSGNYHSNQMKVTERFTPITDNHIQYEATIDDPVVFTRPWTISMPLYRRLESNAELFQYNCVEFAEPLLYSEHLKDPSKYLRTE